MARRRLSHRGDRPRASWIRDGTHDSKPCPRAWWCPIEGVNHSAAAKVVRYCDAAPRPWANGTGVTRVIAVGAPTDPAAAFDWRLSVAEVTSGPFSQLPGIDRVITLADGPGMALTVDDTDVSLEPFRPYRFSGDASVRCQTTCLVHDFNVMTRRRVADADVSIRVGSGHLAAPMTDVTYVVPLHESAQLRFAGGHHVVLSRFDSMLLPAAAELRVARGGRTAVVRIHPRTPGPAGHLQATEH